MNIVAIASKISVFLLLMCLGNLSYAVLINPGFADGLNGWSVEGDDVKVTASDEAYLGDNDLFGITSLYQNHKLEIGQDYTFEFDFSSTLSADVPFGVFPDLFASSLLFVDDLSSFDLLTGSYDNALALVDIDHTGEYYGAFSEISISDKGVGWSHLSANFTASHHYVIGLFDMLDGNFLVDSYILIDNVALTAKNAIDVAEPTNVFIVGVLFAFLFRIFTLRTNTL